MKGFTLSERAVRRVSRSVKWTESQATDVSRPPRIERKVPPRWPGVYEVTSVDTGAGTCDVQRHVDDTTTGDTTWTCDYDSEPTTGDLGAILRKGDGSLFFFRKTGGGTSLNQWYVGANVRTVEEAGGDGTRKVYAVEKYNGSSWSLDTYVWVAYKLDTTQSISASTDMVVRPMDSGAIATQESAYYRASGATDIRCSPASWLYRYVAILEDFTLSTIDESTLNGLNTKEVTWTAALYGLATEGITSDGRVQNANTNYLYPVMQPINLSSGDTVYGYAVLAATSGSRQLSTSPAANDQHYASMRDIDEVRFGFLDAATGTL